MAGNGFRGQAFAIGPALRYQFDKAGLELRWLKEFEVRNRPEGDALWLKLVLPL